MLLASDTKGSVLDTNAARHRVLPIPTSQAPHKQWAGLLTPGAPPRRASSATVKLQHAQKQPHSSQANVPGPDLEAAREVAFDQTSLDTRRGRPCSSTSKRRLALSSSSTVAPANLRAPTAPSQAGCCKLQARQQPCRGHTGPQSSMKAAVCWQSAGGSFAAMPHGRWPNPLAVILRGAA